MKNIPKSVTAHIAEISERLKKYPKLAELYKNCYPNTLETTAEILADGSTFLYTGDIPAMWLRDSTAQVTHYLPLTKDDPEIRSIIRGLIVRQLAYIRIDPYANAFNIEKTVTVTPRIFRKTTRGFGNASMKSTRFAILSVLPIFIIKRRVTIQ